MEKHAAFVLRSAWGSRVCESGGTKRIGVEARKDCHRCVDDKDCIFAGNPCEGVVCCAHRDAVVITTSIGCVPEPRPPSHDQCICQDGYCHVRGASF